MSDNDDSAIHKLVTLAGDAVKAVEAKIDDAMAEADAELVKGPSHIGEGEPDVFGFLPDDTSQAIPVLDHPEDLTGPEDPIKKTESPHR